MSLNNGTLSISMYTYRVEIPIRASTIHQPTLISKKEAKTSPAPVRSTTRLYRHCHGYNISYYCFCVPSRIQTSRTNSRIRSSLGPVSALAPLTRLFFCPFVSKRDLGIFAFFLSSCSSFSFSPIHPLAWLALAPRKNMPANRPCVKVRQVVGFYFLARLHRSLALGCYRSATMRGREWAITSVPILAVCLLLVCETVVLYGVAS